MSHANPAAEHSLHPQLAPQSCRLRVRSRIRSETLAKPAPRASLPATPPSASPNFYRRINRPDNEPTTMKMPKQIIGLALASLAIIKLTASQIDGQSTQQGQAVFQKRCAGCHALEADHEGPRLKGVVGREAGAVKTFTYSKSLHNAGFTWDEARLDKWLTDTESLVPDNDMSFRVPNPEERAAIIAYLKSVR